MDYNPAKRTLAISRELSNLDKLVIKFCKILEKHAQYVLISGYISILTGRSRTTEDIDLFIKKISLEQFSKLYSDLKENGFWCVNAENTETIFSYLQNKQAVRFAINNTSVPNFEVKFPKRPIDEETFDDCLTVSLPGAELKISSFERHIAFKRVYLGSDKDIEDSIHIEDTFGKQIDYGKVDKLKERVEIIKEEETRNELQE